MPKLYIGAPITMISAAFNSATNSSDSAKSAFSSVVLGSPRTAVAAVASKWGRGCAAKSRTTMLWPFNFSMV